MINNSLLIASAIALMSIIWVELVRDSYHLLSHLWQPLYRLHSWHHRIFKPDLSVKSETIYRQANWYNDLPESLVMLLLSFGFGLFVLSQGWVAIEYQWLVWLGSVYTLTFSLGAIARGLGIPYADEITDVTTVRENFSAPCAV